MINIKELMIGNWITFSNDSNTEIKVNEAMFARLYEYPEELEDYDFIPLTEKRLIDLGFVKKDFDRWVIEENVFGEKVETYFILDEDGILTFNKGNSYLTDLFWVHQLQNILFVLSNKELKLKK